MSAFRHKINNLLVLSIIFCIFAVCLAGCQGSESSDSDTGGVSFQLQLEDVPNTNAKAEDSILSAAIDCSATGIASIECNIYESNGSRLSGKSFTCSAHQGVVDGMVPGSGRRAVFEAKNSKGNNLYEAEVKNVTINPGQITPLGQVTLAYVGGTDDDNQSPTAAITSPSDNSTYTSGQSITFTGTGIDPEDGDVLGSTFVWTSSRDGQIKTGQKSFSTSSLSVGTHTITLTISDKNGASDSASINVFISSASSIDNDGDGYNADVDCDDNDNNINPGEPEIECDGIDQDCDGNDECPSDPDNGLVAYYPFNGNANDESGNGNDGTVHGATLTTDRFGNANKAYSFDGENDYIKPSYAALDSASFSFCAWIKTSSPNEIDGSSMVFGGRTGRTSSIIFVATEFESRGGDGFFTQIMGFNGGTRPEIDTSINLIDDQWHCIVISSGTEYFSLYIDGKLAGKDTQTTGGDLTEEALIGAYSNACETLPDCSSYIENSHFSGLIDDVRIYDRALSESEVLSLYNQEKPQSNNEDGLVAYYPFNGNAIDESGNGNDGNIVGNVSFEAISGENQAAVFPEGVNYISISQSSATTFTTEDFTISLWFQTNDQSDDVLTLFNTRNTSSCSSATGPVIESFIRSGWTRFLVRGNDNIKSSIITDDLALNNGHWHHYLVLRDAGILKMYVDGNLVGQTAINPAVDFTTSSNFFIGRDKYCTDKPFNGLIDEFRIYNRALSESEIQSLYSEDTSGSPTIVYQEDFSSDPGYTPIISSTAGSSQVRWTGDAYYAKVYDQNADWWCLGHSPAFTPFSTDEDFTIEFDFNPMTMDWGSYPAIYFHGTKIENLDEFRASSASGNMFRLCIDYGDGSNRELRFIFASSVEGAATLYDTGSVPNDNEWYHVRIAYHANNATADLLVLGPSGATFYQADGVSAPISGTFQYLSIGQVGGSPAYGDMSEIKVDNILITQ